MRYFICVCTLMFIGCTPQTAKHKGDWEGFGRDAAIITVEHHGHQYVVFDGFKAGGIIHSADCSCLKDKQ